MLRGVRALEKAIHISGLLLSGNFHLTWYVVAAKRSFDPLKTDVTQTLILLLKLMSSLCEIRMGEM